MKLIYLPVDKRARRYIRKRISIYKTKEELKVCLFDWLDHVVTQFSYTRKSKMSHMDIANRLALIGYMGELQDFDNILARLWWSDYEIAHSTVEAMLHHCMVARQFCDEVRRQAQIWCEDSEILSRLTNIRKSGFLNASKPAIAPPGN